MTSTRTAFAAILIIGAFGAGSDFKGASPAYAACDPGDRVNGTTADMARRKMMAAGFRQVRDLKKGCDSVWHGIAVKDGTEMRVAVSPAGEVMLEND